MNPQPTPAAHVPDMENTPFQKAVSFVLDTQKNIFLTGKAGSGKTTFLKYIKTETKKQCAIVAPTGVAAINAGGETIHSFLQLPLGPFVPGNAGGFGKRGDNTEDRHSLLANMRMNAAKIKLLRKLELLIIDEVSMVRCDMLDAIDLVLRHVRKNSLQPFGGVQMVFIGDLFQLPPVVREEEWEILSRFYRSPYFFDSLILREYPPLYIELKKVYRQKEQGFINILNRVRNGNVTEHDIVTLNKRHRPAADKEKEDGSIILSTHNHTVETINRQALHKLNVSQHNFQGTIEKDFNTRNLPTDLILELKEGAQVMFIRNDTQTPRRYYNGKVGRVATINKEGIFITFPEDKEQKTLLLEKETWKNIRYSYNNQKRAVDEEELGSFTQYPIRLAWAVTVHKSQGLTLEKVVVDLNRSFASGQVYVALSRCTTLEGLTLRSPLNSNNIMVDERVIEFAKTERGVDELEHDLAQSAREAKYAQLCKVFSFTALIEEMEQLLLDNAKRKTGPREQSAQLLQQMTGTLREAETHAEKFYKQLITLTEESILQQRLSAAARYFTEKVINPCIAQTGANIITLSGHTKIAKQLKAWRELKNNFQGKINEMNGITVGTN